MANNACLTFRVLIAAAVLSAASSYQLQAQELIPFRYTSEDDNELLNENDSVRIYAATNDSANVLTINEDLLWYKLISKKDRKRKVAEGGIAVRGDGYVQHGYCVLYYGNGKPQISGSYLKGKPAGLWEEYYPNGKRKKCYTYGVFSDQDGTYSCLTGSYAEYYENGRLKANGLYLADRKSIEENVQVDDPISGAVVVRRVLKSEYSAQKTGPWKYYLDTGELDKEEEL